MTEFKILDLFSGAGGLSFGLDLNKGFKTVVATDFFKSSLSTLKHNSPQVHTVYGDITDDTVKNEILVSAKERGVNMVVGGPPCQGFSNKGKKLGLNDPRNFLFLEFVDVVSKISPELFIIENVKALMTATNGYFIEEIRSRFEDLGYIVSIRVLKASDYGVPQARERTIIVGSKTLSFNFDTIERSTDITTVRDAISDLAYLESGQGVPESKYINEPTTEYQRIIRNNSSKLLNHVATTHSPIALKKLSLIPPEKGKEYLPPELLGNQKFKTTWGRLVWDEVSPTIDTRFDTPSNGKNSHPVLNRAITPREAARIQSFPDNYLFMGSKTEICKQIGNAVPPLMAKALGQAIKEQYEVRNTSITTSDEVSLINDDAYNKVKELVNKGIRVDHIITDPPYNISAENNFNTMRSPRSGVDFGEWDKGFDLTSWIKLYRRILNKDGSMIIFCSYKYISSLVDALESSNMVVKDVIIWKKTNPMPRNIRRRYVQDMEFAIWAVAEKAKWVFNKPDDTPYLRSLFEAPTVAGGEKNGHPTQKSLAVMEQLIRIHTNPGDVILDPFMGSGTTGVAAVSNSRKFVGIELDPRYYKISCERINSIAYPKTFNTKLSKVEATESDDLNSYLIEKNESTQSIRVEPFLSESVL